MAKNRIAESISKTASEALDKGLAARAVLVSLSIGKPTLSKQDRNESEKVTRAAGAVSGAATVSRKLYPGQPLIEAISSNLNKVRTAVYEYTVPFGRDGWLLLPANKLDELSDLFNKHFGLHKEMLDRLLAEYPSIVAEAERNLGGLARKRDYSGPGHFAEKWRLELAVQNLTGAKVDNLVGVSDEVQKAINEANEKRLAENLRRGMTAVVEGAAETINKLVEGLDRKASGKGTFRDSLIENVHETAAKVEAANIYGDPEIAKLADRLRALANASPEQVRESEDVLKKMKEAAVEIENDLAGAF